MIVSAEAMTKLFVLNGSQYLCQKVRSDSFSRGHDKTFCARRFAVFVPKGSQ